MRAISFLLSLASKCLSDHYVIIGTQYGGRSVYGIVQQNGGVIDVKSILGKGTEFDIYLPRFDGDVEAPEKHSLTESLRGDETILIVEDQAELLELAKIILERNGYKVLAALSPGEALLISEAYPKRIHLLLTDVIMPTMSGKVLAGKIENLRTGIRTLFMSGFAANVLRPQGIFDDNIHFIQKPFSSELLAKKVKEILSLP